MLDVEAKFPRYPLTFGPSPIEKLERLSAHLGGQVVWHGYYGYSVGLGFPPTWADQRDLIIKKGSDVVLESGMVFHCSTSLNISQAGKP